MKKTFLTHPELAVLFFLHGAALSAWFVPLGRVLDSHELGSAKPMAYAASAIAAFVSPLWFGAMADRHASPVKVLRGLALATAASMSLASAAIHWKAGPGLTLLAIQVHSLCSSPTWPLSCTVVFARLANSKHEFGPLRAVGTFGWMAGCWLVSALGADASPGSGFAGSLIWLGVAAMTWRLPKVEAPNSSEGLTLRQRLGLDALDLLRVSDHRIVFFTAALLNVPLAAFYPYTPPHLRELGLERTSAWMTLGQITEIAAMFMLGGLITRWRLKWIFVAGLSCGVLRFALCALDQRGFILGGIALHGFSYTLVFITAQIYIDERIDPAWRARAQALLVLLTSGFGNLAGYLGTGWWHAYLTGPQGTRWSLYWASLAVSVGFLLVLFLVAYHGRPDTKRTGRTRTTSPSD